MTDDGRYLVLTQWEGTHRESRIFVRDLQDPRPEIVPFLDRFDASYSIVGNDGAVFYVVTDKDAGRNRLVAINLATPQPRELDEPDSRAARAGCLERRRDDWRALSHGGPLGRA